MHACIPWHFMHKQHIQGSAQTLTLHFSAKTDTILQYFPITISQTNINISHYLHRRKKERRRTCYVTIIEEEEPLVALWVFARKRYSSAGLMALCPVQWERFSMALCSLRQPMGALLLGGGCPMHDDSRERCNI